jgi:hypothetical protein
MKRLTAVLTTILLIGLSTGVYAQQTETLTEARIIDGKVQQVRTTTTEEILQEFNRGERVSKKNLRRLSEKGLLDQLVREEFTADTSDYPICVSIFPQITYEIRYKSKAFIVKNGTIKRAPERDRVWTSNNYSGWFFSLIFLALPLLLIAVKFKKNIREERTVELSKFYGLSIVCLTLIALSTLLGYGYIMDTESLAGGVFIIFTALLVVYTWIASGVILDYLRQIKRLQGSVGAMMIYGVFIIILPKNLYLQAIILYAGLCISAYLIIRGIDYLVERKAEKDRLAAQNS